MRVELQIKGKTNRSGDILKEGRKAPLENIPRKGESSDSPGRNLAASANQNPICDTEEQRASASRTLEGGKLEQIQRKGTLCQPIPRPTNPVRTEKGGSRHQGGTQQNGGKGNGGGTCITQDDLRGSPLLVRLRWRRRKKKARNSFHVSYHWALGGVRTR